MRGVKVVTGAVAAVLLVATAALSPVLAETIEGALVRAYRNNPQLNAQRAQVRSTDENVPQALSGYRPKVNIDSSIGYQYTDTLEAVVSPASPPLTCVQATKGGPCLPSGLNPPLVNQLQHEDLHGTNPPRMTSLTATQNLYNGNQTANRVRAAESQVSGAREALRVLEQTVLFNAASVYMDYLRDAAIVEVNKSNVRVLEQTLEQTRDRFNVGEVTRTDVAQSEAQLAAGKSQEQQAESTLTTTRSNYRRIIGAEPQSLAPGSPVDRFLPKTLQQAIDMALIENPNVTAAMYGIDVNFLQVKIAEGALLPTVNLQAAVEQDYEQTLLIQREFSASVLAQVHIPLYQGGTEYAMIRQSKENLAQQRLNLETTRNQARADVVTAWGQLVAGKAQVASAQSQVTASEVALNGVREEAKAGQRTTLDVLNAQQALVNARVALVTAQHDRVVASYAVLEAIGRLAPQVLNLPTTVYDPSVHYHQVRDSWFGLRTPDGR